GPARPVPEHSPLLRERRLCCVLSIQSELAQRIPKTLDDPRLAPVAMAASLLLRRRELASPLGTLAASVQSTYAANVCSRWRGSGRTLSAKATQNEVTGTDLGTDKSCGVMEGKTDYTDEMWTKDREEIKHMKAEYEEHMRTCRKQMDALFERERCVDKKLARLKKKLDRIERVCNVMTFILIPVIVVGILNML
uniref:Uncharacterized protein n=1 Tax=Aegilops tauschii subsp. strangulata TaxID=200361 RepID=A0A453ADU4_AEGTS